MSMTQKTVIDLECAVTEYCIAQVTVHSLSGKFAAVRIPGCVGQGTPQMSVAAHTESEWGKDACCSETMSARKLSALSLAPWFVFTYPSLVPPCNPVLSDRQLCHLPCLLILLCPNFKPLGKPAHL